MVTKNQFEKQLQQINEYQVRGSEIRPKVPASAALEVLNCNKNSRRRALQKENAPTVWDGYCRTNSKEGGSDLQKKWGLITY